MSTASELGQTRRELWSAQKEIERLRDEMKDYAVLTNARLVKIERLRSALERIVAIDPRYGATTSGTTRCVDIAREALNDE